MRSAAESPEVFEYLDYRKYLRDFYASRKRGGRGFSYRAFSRRAQLQSPNYLKLVIEGQRNLTGPMANRFATACGLDGVRLQPLPGDKVQQFPVVAEYMAKPRIAKRGGVHRNGVEYRLNVGR